MRLKSKILSSALALIMIICTLPVFAADEAGTSVELAIDSPRQMEYLTRGGFAATNPTGGIYLSWRLLGTEPMDTAFNIYKNSELLIQTDNTSYTDTNGTADDNYSVAPVINGVEGTQSELFMKLTGYRDSAWENSPYAYFDIPLNVPSAGSNYTYSPNDASVGDVDGDGEYEIILKWDPSNSKDNASSGITGNVYIDCYEYDGTFLWRIDLGRNIRAGAHYTQFQVYDYDGDGKAEVAMKTAPGSIDGKGNYVSAVGNTDTIKAADNSKSYVNSRGHIAGGPEFLTIFNGETGAAMQTIEYDPLQTSGSWGDSDYNRSERYLAGTAYLDGVHPSMIFCRGYYARAVAVAYDWDGTNLTKRWKLDSAESGNSDFAAQGHHQLSVADLDNDGKDEIVYGGAAIDDDGSLLWSVYYKGNKLGHGDALHVSDFDNDGMQEIFKVNEDKPNWGRAYIETNGTEATLSWIQVTTDDDGRGAMANFSSKYGVLAWDSGTNVRTLDGTVVNKNVLFDNGQSYPNFPIYWDGDLLREHYDKCRIQKWTDYDEPDTDGNLGTFGRILAFSGVTYNNSSKQNPCLQADLFGDWREELIFRTSDDSALRVFTSLIPTEHKLTTFMHDSQYRCAIAWQNTGYNSPPHQSYYIGEDKTDYVQPNIETVKLKPEIRLTVTADGVPVSGVSVKLGNTEKPTDSNGIVSFRVNPGTYDYTVDQVGYKLSSGTVVHNEGVDPTEQTIVLETLPDSTITVTSQGKAVSGATAVIEGQTAVTDENGKVVLKLRSGQNSYTVSCHKFVTKTGTLDISENGSSENIEIEPVQYVYDSTTDTEGSKFTYSGGSGAELSFSGGTWTFNQNSTDGGRSFGADFDASSNGSVVFEMTYGTGGQKDTNAAWNWAGRPYTHEIKLLDTNGNTLIGLSQEYLESGAQQVQYYTGAKSKTNVSSGTAVGAPNFTARSATTWEIVFNIDLKAKTVDLTMSGDGGSYVVTNIPIDVTSFSGVTVSSTASGNVTWAPTIKDVLYWSDCPVSNYKVSLGTITGNGDLKIVKPVPTPAPIAPDSWSASKELSAGASLINTSNAAITSDASAAYTTASTKVGGVTYAGRINVRVTSDTDMTPNASGNTALTVQAKKSGTLTLIYRRQYANGSVANGDGKDVRLANANSLGTLLNGTTFTYEDVDGSYANATKTYALEAGQTYKIYGVSTTIGMFAVKYEPESESAGDEILVDELTVYNGDIITIKATTEEEETTITTNPDVDVTDIGNGYYTFIMPESDTTVNAEFKSTSAYPYTINKVQESVDGISVNLTKNFDTDPGTNTVIVAAYDSISGALRSIGFNDVTLSVGASDDINVELEYSDSDLVVAYVWNSMSNIAPLSKSKNLN